MKHVHFFQWNIPAENHYIGRADKFVNVMAETNLATYADGRPIVYTSPINVSFYDLMQVKDWHTAKEQIEECAEKYFMELARQQRIAEARAVLIAENEPTGVPTLDLFTQDMNRKEIVV